MSTFQHGHTAVVEFKIPEPVEIPAEWILQKALEILERLAEKEKNKMKATLEFTLPEEQMEHMAALQGGRAVCAINELFSYLRQEIKYGDPDKKTYDALEAVRTRLREIVDQYELVLDY